MAVSFQSGPVTLDTFANLWNCVYNRFNVSVMYVLDSAHMNFSI